MYTTEQEIREQYQALKKTIEYLQGRKAELRPVLAGVKSLVVMGCGSSYSLAKSAALQYSQLNGVPAYAVAAGDLLVNFESYGRILNGAAVMVLSRSGSTSEAVRAATRCKEVHGCQVISVCAKENSPMEAVADVNLLVPWAFDYSVCQTRTVNNLYVCGLMIAAIGADDEAMLKAVDLIPAQAEPFCTQADPVMKAVGEKEWNKAVVLADSGIAGLAEEGALAFKEICRRDSNHYHILDVRHGPMVQIDPHTLVIVWVSCGDHALQADLIEDLKKHTDKILVLSADPAVRDLTGCTAVVVPDCGADEASAVYMLYCVQLVTLYHALAIGVDPDAPEGLDAWIKL